MQMMAIRKDKPLLSSFMMGWKKPLVNVASARIACDCIIAKIYSVFVKIISAFIL
jgi:hypothetical protein